MRPVHGPPATGQAAPLLHWQESLLELPTGWAPAGQRWHPAELQRRTWARSQLACMAARPYLHLRAFGGPAPTTHCRGSGSGSGSGLAGRRAAQPVPRCVPCLLARCAPGKAASAPPAPPCSLLHRAVCAASMDVRRQLLVKRGTCWASRCQLAPGASARAKAGICAAGSPGQPAPARAAQDRGPGAAAVRQAAGVPTDWRVSRAAGGASGAGLAARPPLRASCAAGSAPAPAPAGQQAQRRLGSATWRRSEPGTPPPGGRLRLWGGRRRPHRALHFGPVLCLPLPSSPLPSALCDSSGGGESVSGTQRRRPLGPPGPTTTTSGFHDQGAFDKRPAEPAPQQCRPCRLRTQQPARASARSAPSAVCAARRSANHHGPRRRCPGGRRGVQAHRHPADWRRR